MVIIITSVSIQPGMPAMVKMKSHRDIAIPKSRLQIPPCPDLQLVFTTLTLETKLLLGIVACLQSILYNG